MVVSTADDIEFLHVFLNGAQYLREGSMNQLPPKFSEVEIGPVLSITLTVTSVHQQTLNL